MPEGFQFDVFLSHSSKDKALVREVAARLKKDGVRVWVDEEQIKPGDSIPAKIEEGLENSRVLVLCMSANAFGSDWAQLEAGTFRFRDPRNKDRRRIPLRLDDASIKGSLAQFLYIKWGRDDNEQAYRKLLDACQHLAKSPKPGAPSNLDASVLNRVREIAASARKEWERIQHDFEIQAQKYPEFELKILCIVRNQVFPVPDNAKESHMINLWQYFGTGEKARERLAASERTTFGVMGAEVSAYGVMLGPETDLFCRMASRAGSLLPDNIDDTILYNVRKHYVKSADGKGSIIVANRNPLAKWLNLLVMSTVHMFPTRFESGRLVTDPFAASLTVFDVSLADSEA